MFRPGQPLRQWLFVDVRGQSVSDLRALAAQIRGDVPLFERIHFITDGGIFHAL
jgi:hypothetical protein